MPETSFDRLGRPTAGPATVNKIGPGWGVEAAHAVAHDTKLHLPFDRLPPPPPPQPPPVMPTETDLRTELADAIQQHRQAEAVQIEAEDALERGLTHHEKCRDAVAGFEGLDDSIALSLADRLRAGGLGATPDGLKERRRQRDDAAADLRAADAALATLGAELEAAVRGREQAQRRRDRLVCGILGFAACKLVDHREALLREAHAILQELRGFDQFCANRGVLPGKVSSVLLGDAPGGIAKLFDHRHWTTAADALLADPMAEIDVS